MNQEMIAKLRRHISAMEKSLTPRFSKESPALAGFLFVLLIFIAGLAPLRAESLVDQNKMLSDVDFTQRLNQQLPMNLTFRDDGGRPVMLSRYFHGSPVILSLVYYRCPGLCTESLNGLLRVMRSLSYNAGRQYEVVTLSFDDRESPRLASAKKRVYVERYGRPSGAQGWAFLTGDKASIRRLTDAVGFNFAYDRELAQFAHATGIVVLTPDGKISRYLYGVEYSARELKLALLEASAGKIGSLADEILLYCYHYDPASGRYSVRILKILRVLGVATVGLLIAAIVFLRRGEVMVEVGA